LESVRLSFFCAEKILYVNNGFGDHHRSDRRFIVQVGGVIASGAIVVWRQVGGTFSVAARTTAVFVLAE
jgi:hypothetical protein